MTGHGENESPREKERHFLVAVDDSDSSRRAVLYVADFLGGTEGLKITLFHVITVPQEECLDGDAGREEWLARSRSEAREILERYRKMLVASGFSEDAVGTALLECGQEPLADVILREHRDLGTCTIVVGRRGKSRQEEFLFGSVSSAIVKHASGCSVWVVE